MHRNRQLARQNISHRPVKVDGWHSTLVFSPSPNEHSPVPEQATTAAGPNSPRQRSVVVQVRSAFEPSTRSHLDPPTHCTVDPASDSKRHRSTEEQVKAQPAGHVQPLAVQAQPVPMQVP